MATGPNNTNTMIQLDATKAKNYKKKFAAHQHRRTSTEINQAVLQPEEGKSQAAVAVKDGEV